MSKSVLFTGTMLTAFLSLKLYMKWFKYVHAVLISAIIVFFDRFCYHLESRWISCIVSLPQRVKEWLAAGECIFCYIAAAILG